jgi:hypothetical protein
MKLTFLHPAKAPLAYKKIYIETAPLAYKETLYLSESTYRYIAYVNPESLEEAVEWVRKHNDLLNSPLMKVLK